MHRADGHGLESVDFLGDLHSADFRGEGRTGTTDDDDGGDKGTEFAGHGNGHSCGYVTDGPEATQFVSGLESEDQANKKCDERQDRDSAYADIEGLRNCSLKTDGFALERGDKGVISRSATEGSKSTNIGQAIGN
jgi:hypothetical protein